MRKDTLVLTGLALTFLGILSAYFERIKADDYQLFLFIIMICAIIVGIVTVITLTIWKSVLSRHVRAIEIGYLSVLFRINVMKGFISMALLDFHLKTTYQIYLIRQCVIIGLASRKELHDNLKNASRSKWINSKGDKYMLASQAAMYGLVMMDAYFRFKSYKSELENESLIDVLLAPQTGWATFLDPKSAYEGILKYEGVIELSR